MLKYILFIAALLAPGLAHADNPADGGPALDSFIAARGPTFDFDASTADTTIAPIVHFTCEDNAASTVVTNKANAALNGTANRNTNAWSTASGKIGRGFDFYNGSTADKIDLGADVIGANGAFTFCAWIKWDSTGGAAYGRIFASAGDVNLAHDGGAPNKLSVLGKTSANNYYTTATINHLCVDRQGSVARVFWNGALSESIADVSTAATLRYIGNRADDARYHDGIMDDIRIYDRALTAQEIRDIYNEGAGHHHLAAKKDSHTIALDGTGAVSAIQSKGIEFFQSTAANRPVFAMLNGRRVLSFDGVDDALTSTSALSAVFTAKAKTWAIVASPTDIDAAKVLFGETGDKFQISTNTTGSGVWKFASDATNVEIAGASAATVLRGTHDGTLLKASANGVDGFVSAVNTTAVTGTLELGTDGTSYFAGLVGRIVLWNKVLPESDLLTIEQGLARRYGVSLASATAEVSCDAYIRSLTPTLWLDSNDLSTITKDANNKVSQWCSKVGNVCFTQATAGNQPVWTGDGVQFTRANSQFLSSASKVSDVYAADGKTFFAVVKPDVVNVNQNIMSTYDPITNGLLLYFNSTNYRVQHYDGTYDVTGTGLTVAAGTRYITEMFHDGTNISTVLNGSAAVNEASGNSHANLLNSTIQIASNGVGGDAFDGKITTIITDNSVWTADQRARVRSCLGQAQGISF